MLAALNSRIFAWKVMQKTTLMEIAFTDVGVLFLFFGRLGAGFSGFCYPGNKLGNQWIFGGVTDLERRGWRGEMALNFGPVNSLTADG